MKILGIDPGIARMGWGIIRVESSKLKIESCGCLETSAGLEIEQRLKHLHEELLNVIEKEKPEVLAIEELFFNTNAKTAFIVGQARGVVLLTAAEKNIPVEIYTPLQVKVALTGYGRAEKMQIGQMVKVLLKLDKVPKPDDTADALAIALCHAFSMNFKFQKARQ